MESWGKAEPFLIFGDDGKLHLNENTIVKLESIDKSLCVVCLSYFWKKIDEDKTGYSAAPSNESSGLWIRYVVNHKEPSSAILLLEARHNDLQILEMCLFLSSLFMFNFKMDVEVTTVDDLKFVGNLRQQIVDKMKSVEQSNNCAKFYPIFLQDHEVNINGHLINGQLVNEVDYIEHYIMKTPNDRRVFLHCFPDQNYFTFSPEFNPQKMDQLLNSTANSELSYSILYNFICDKGSVRKIHDKHITGKLFVKMARNYNQVLQSMTIRDIEAYPGTIVESANESLLRKAIKHYNKLMKNELCLEPDVAMLSCYHSHHSLTALDKFLTVFTRYDDDQYCWSMFCRFEERLFESYVSIQNENKSFLVPSRDFLKQFYKKFVQKLVSGEIQSANLKEAVEYCEERLSWWKNKFLKESILKYLNDLTFEDTVMQKTFAAHTDKFKEERKNCKFAETRQASADNVNPFVVANFAQRLLEVKQNCLKNISTNVNASWEDPVQLLTLDDNNKLHLNQEAARKLEKIDKPFAVIAITGIYQSGKTKLFNSIAAKQTASESMGTTETRGMWVWYIEDSTSGGKGVLLLETHGIGSQMCDISFDNRILCLSALLSTVFIFNSRGDEVDALVMEKFVKTLSRCVNHENSTESPLKFVLIVGDVVDKNTRESDVAKRLFSGYQKYPAVQNELIIDFTHCFPEQQCFPLSLITKNVQQFFYNVVTNASVKKINHTYDINGKRFIHLVQEYNKLLEVNALDERVQAVALSIAQCENEIAFQESMEYYHTLFIEKLLFDPKTSRIPKISDMSRFHREFSSRAIDVFLRKCMCNADCVSGGKLLREMHDTYLNILKNYYFALSISESQLFIEFCDNLPDSTRSGEKVLDLEDMKQLNNVESHHSRVNCEDVRVQKWLAILHKAIEERLELQKTIEMNIEQLSNVVALPTVSSEMDTNVFHQIYIKAQETAKSGSWTEPIQLLKPDINGYLTIDQNAIDKLAEIHKPLVIITMAGIYRTGKSYLLNRIARKTNGCFQSLSSGFKVTSSSELETKGLWAWYILHPSDESKGILLLDTHGLGYPETNDSKYDKRITCLSAMLSSVWIFNFRGEIDVTTVEKLTFINNLHNLIFEEGKRKVSAEFAPPKFVLLVRDCQSDIEINGKEVTEDYYMEEKMFSCKDNYPQSHKELIDRFKNYFVDRKCFTLPMPAIGKHIKNLNSITDDNLDSDFVNDFDKLYDHILQTTQVKKCENFHDVNGQKFADLLKTSVDLIQKDLPVDVIGDFDKKDVDKKDGDEKEHPRIKQCKKHYDDLMKENSGLKPNLSAWLECHLICCTIVAKCFLCKNVICDEDLNLYKSLLECFHDSCATYAKNHFATYFDKHLEQLCLSTQSGEEYFYHDSTATYIYNSMVKFRSWLFPTDPSKVNMTKLQQNFERKLQNFSDNLPKQQISRFLSDMSTLENTVQLINHVLVYLLMESHKRWKIEIVKTDHNNCIHQIVSQMDEKIANFEKGLLHNSVSSKERKLLDRVFTDSEKSWLNQYTPKSCNIM